MEDSVWELQSDVESAWADTLQIISDDFQNAIDTAISAFEKAVSGSYGSLDKMQQAFEQQQKIGDRYVSNYQKIYELSKLNRNITKSIDETDSIRGKQELVALQEEINALQKSDTELSKYDVEYLQKKYDLRLAEIALEEAQNAKSTVRMRRDSEGNYSYVYTADEDKTADAAQNYEDKLYEMQRHSQDYIDEMESQLIQNYMDMTEELAGLREEDFNSYEEFEAEKNRILEYYRSNHAYILDEMNKALINSNTTYNEDWLNYEGYNDKKLIADSNWRTQFSDTFTAQTTGYTTVAGALAVFDETTAPLMDNIAQGYKDWKTAAEEAFEIVGQEFDKFGGENGRLKTDIQNITTKLDDVDEAFGEWKSSAQSGFQDIIDEANSHIDTFRSSMSEYSGIISSLAKQLEAFFKLAATEVDAQAVTDATNEVVKTNQSGGDTGSESGSTNVEKNKATKVQQFLKNNFSEFSNLAVDGIYGSKTQAAATKYNGESAITGEALDLDDAYKMATQGVFLMRNDTNKDGKYSGDEVFKSFISEEQYQNWLNSSYDNEMEAEQYTKIGASSLGRMRPTKQTSTTPVEEGPKPFEPGARIAPTREDGMTYSVYEGLYGGLKTYKKYGVVENYSTIREKKTDLNGATGYWTGLMRKVGGYANSGSFFVDQSGENAVPSTQRQEDIDAATYYNNHPDERDGYYSKVYYLNYVDYPLKSFDTGGYTGSWDSSGRLAMLHQKEIVLNAHDTENFLAAVNIVRDIASAIDLRAAAYEHQLSSMAYAYSAGGVPQMLQQDVTIHAEFPNVRERSEIEAAFDNLINRASQFANRKNK